MTGTRVVEWRPYRNGVLLGFCKLQYPSGMTLAEVAVMHGPHGVYAATPTRPLVKDGIVVRDKHSGKVRNGVLIDSPNKEVRNQWSDSVIAALREAYPDFDSEATKEFEDE